MNATIVANGSSAGAITEAFPEALVLASMMVNLFLSLTLNVYVMWLILTGARETLAADFFPLNLSISETLFALSAVFFCVFMISREFVYLEIVLFFRGLLFTARPLFQCCICVECYIAVAHPVLFLRLKPLRYRAACCCVAWPIIFASCAYNFYTYSHFKYLYLFFIQSLIFIFVMFFCLLSVLRALTNPGPGEKDPQKKKRSNAMKKRAFKVIVLIMISMAVSFFMFLVGIPLQSCSSCIDFNYTFTICFCFVFLTGFTQPSLYLLRAKKLLCFRES